MCIRDSSYAGARHRTPYGDAAISWRIEGTSLWAELTVPVGATAILELPGAPAEELGHGVHVRTAAWADDRSTLTPEADLSASSA